MNRLPSKTAILSNRADPWVYRHSDGYYYFTASVPEYDGIELRKAKTLDQLSAAETATVWTKHETGQMSKHIWAPELHYIDDAWYVYFAAGERDDIWKIRPYVLRCKDENPLEGHWEEMGMVARCADDPYSFNDFSLDMTTFSHNGRRFAIWAQKVGGQFGISNLYLAEMENPYTLATIPVLLTTPDYDWERVGFWVNEGPAVIKRDNKIFVSFSASATDHHYCMGLLWADCEADLHDPGVWSKLNKPVLSSDDSAGFYGPGHNSFTVLPDGRDVIIYHAREYKDITGDPLYDPNRHSYAAVLNWNDDGTPDIAKSFVNLL